MWSRFLSLLKMTLKVRVSLEIYSNERRNCGTFRVLTSVWLNFPVQLPAQVHPLPLRGVDWKGWRIVWGWAELQKCLCREKWGGWEGKAGDRGGDDHSPQQEAVNRSTRISFQLWGARGSQGHTRGTEFSFYSFPSLQGTHRDTHLHILTSASHPGPSLLLQLGPRAPSLGWPCLAPSPGRCLPLYQLLSESFLVGILSLPSPLSLSFSRVLISIGLTSHHTFLFASCLLPLLERKQEGRYFYLSDALLWPQPLE